MSTSRNRQTSRALPILALAVLPALLLSSPPARAQDGAPAAPRVRSWSLELVSGPSLGGPVEDLESAMRNAGFDDTSPGGWFGGGGTTYPQSDTGALSHISYWGAVRRRLGHGPWQVGIGGGATEFGSVTGYQRTSASAYDGLYLYAGGRVATLAPMAWFEPVPALRLGAGPAIHRVDLDLGPSGNPAEGTTRSWNAGFVVEAAVTFPVDTPVFFIALAQYRWAGDATTGPWQGTTYSGIRVEFPATSLSVSYGFVALGIGGRF